MANVYVSTYSSTRTAETHMDLDNSIDIIVSTLTSHLSQPDGAYTKECSYILAAKRAGPSAVITIEASCIIDQRLLS